VEKVDVVILTKDSDDLLRACLNSVYDNIPVNRLIVVDGRSRDLTLQILDEFEAKHGNVKVIEEDGTRGRARDTGIREVETEWFVFVDSDVILCRDWFRKACRLIGPDVGAVWGVDIPGPTTNRLMVRVLLWMESRVFDLRGGCHDLLVRREAVKDIHIPSQLHTMEDAYIRDWIVSQHYRVVKSLAAYSRHYKTMGSMFSGQSIRSSVLELRDAKSARERWVYNAVFAAMWALYGIQSRSGREIGRAHV
jgi:glycosyltransferase involved in cell wall biosynthesis